MLHLAATGSWSQHRCIANNSCGGRQQSPVNIETFGVLHDISLKALHFEGHDVPFENFTVTSDGLSLTLRASPLDTTSRTVRGGRLPGTFVFQHALFHWGSGSGQGSEHRIDGVAYPMEVHYGALRTPYRRCHLLHGGTLWRTANTISMVSPTPWRYTMAHCEHHIDFVAYSMEVHYGALRTPYRWCRLPHGGTLWRTANTISMLSPTPWSYGALRTPYRCCRLPHGGTLWRTANTISMLSPTPWRYTMAHCEHHIDGVAYPMDVHYGALRTPYRWCRLPHGGTLWRTANTISMVSPTPWMYTMAHCEHHIDVVTYSMEVHYGALRTPCRWCRLPHGGTLWRTANTISTLSPTPWRYTMAHCEHHIDGVAYPMEVHYGALRTPYRFCRLLHGGTLWRTANTISMVSPTPWMYTMAHCEHHIDVVAYPMELWRTANTISMLSPTPWRYTMAHCEHHIDFVAYSMEVHYGALRTPYRWCRLLHGGTLWRTANTISMLSPTPWRYTMAHCEHHIDVVAYSMEVHYGALRTPYRCCRLPHGVMAHCEHHIDVVAYSMEMQMVYTNKKYSAEVAANEKDGVAIIATLYRATFVDFDSVKAMRTVVAAVNSSAPKRRRRRRRLLPWMARRLGVGRHGASGDESATRLTLDSLMPSVGRAEFFTYRGSLTVPPCTESVRWTVFNRPAFISETVLQKFRSLKDYTGTKPLADNFRPPQKLNGRRIISSFPPF
ncbi:hypothetical protein MRX96_018893 [Rhipicephalus microplus]